MARSELSPTKLGAPADAVPKILAMARVKLKASLLPIMSEPRLHMDAPKMVRFLEKWSSQKESRALFTNYEPYLLADAEKVWEVGVKFECDLGEYDRNALLPHLPTLVSELVIEYAELCPLTLSAIHPKPVKQKRSH